MGPNARVSFHITPEASLARRHCKTNGSHTMEDSDKCYWSTPRTRNVKGFNEKGTTAHTLRTAILVHTTLQKILICHMSALEIDVRFRPAPH